MIQIMELVAVMNMLCMFRKVEEFVNRIRKTLYVNLYLVAYWLYVKLK